MSIFRDFGAASNRNAAPATTVIVIAIIASFVLAWGAIRELPSMLAFVSAPSVAFSRPWTFFTFSFAVIPNQNSAIGIFFGCVWLWSIGGSVERELGLLKYIFVWFGFSALSAICVLVGSSVLHLGAVALASPWIPLSMVTVMWGTRNPDAPLTFMFVLPITGKWLAWLSAALVFFATTPPSFPLAACAAVPCILAYFFAANKIAFMPFSKADLKYMGGAKKWERYDKSYYEEVQRREKDRDERERLRKLFEGSIQDDPEKDR